MHTKSKIWSCLLIALALAPFAELAGATYYLDNNTGDDARDGKAPRIIYCKPWKEGWSDKLNFHDNFVINLSRKAVYSEGESKNNEYSHNLFFGVHPSTEPSDATKLLTDPMLVKPGGAKIGIASAIAAYSPRAGAPEVGAGAAFRLAAEKNGVEQSGKY